MWACSRASRTGTPLTVALNEPPTYRSWRIASVAALRSGALKPVHSGGAPALLEGDVPRAEEDDHPDPEQDEDRPEGHAERLTSGSPRGSLTIVDRDAAGTVRRRLPAG
jgi:hypothetical protein